MNDAQATPLPDPGLTDVVLVKSEGFTFIELDLVIQDTAAGENWVLDIKEDVTPLESAHLAQMFYLLSVAISTRMYDISLQALRFIQAKKLERHFKREKENDPA